MKHLRASLIFHGGDIRVVSTRLVSSFFCELVFVMNIAEVLPMLIINQQSVSQCLNATSYSKLKTMGQIIYMFQRTLKLKEKMTAFLLKLNFSMLNYCVKKKLLFESMIQSHDYIKL